MIGKSSLLYYRSFSPHPFTSRFEVVLECKSKDLKSKSLKAIGSQRSSTQLKAKTKDGEEMKMNSAFVVSQASDVVSDTPGYISGVQWIFHEQLVCVSLFFLINVLPQNTTVIGVFIAHLQLLTFPILLVRKKKLVIGYIFVRVVCTLIDPTFSCRNTLW